MVAFIQPSVMLLFIFVFNFLFSCVVGHLTFFHIDLNYVNFGQKVQYFIYTRQGAQNYVHADRKQFMAPKNRNI